MATTNTTITTIIDTGHLNNLSWLNAPVAQEVLENVQKTLTSYCAGECDAIPLLPTSENVFVLPGPKSENYVNMSKANSNLRVKLFLFPEIYNTATDAEVETIVEEALTATVDQLGIPLVDTLIFSIQTPNEQEVLPVLKRFWIAAERHITQQSGKKRLVCSLGTADLSAAQLEQLYAEVTIKPFSTQINLDACCDIPADLSAFAKAHSIQLTTHTDLTVDIVPIEQLKTLIDDIQKQQQQTEKQKQHLPTSEKLARKWIAKYNASNGQAILLAKGYLVSLVSTTATTTDAQ